MKLKHLPKLLFGLLLLAAAGCSDNDDNGGKKTDPPTITVSTDAIELGSEAGSSETFTVKTTATWTATAPHEGITLDPASGTGDATVRVTASAANDGTEAKTLGIITVAAAGIEKTESIAVRQRAGETPEPPVEPGDVTITVDFAEGPGIAVPALPASSNEALTGRHEYQIGGHTFAVYADAEDSGKFYWTDNSQYFPAEEPCKGLYFSKTGAYVEFPVLAGKALAQIVYFFNNGAGELPSMDILTPEGDFVAGPPENADDGASMTYTLLDPAANTHYRLTVLNRKNAQVSKFVLTYIDAK